MSVPLPFEYVNTLFGKVNYLPATPIVHVGCLTTLGANEIPFTTLIERESDIYGRQFTTHIENFSTWDHVCVGGLHGVDAVGRMGERLNHRIVFGENVTINGRRVKGCFESDDRGDRIIYSLKYEHAEKRKKISPHPTFAFNEAEALMINEAFEKLVIPWIFDYLEFTDEIPPNYALNIVQALRFSCRRFFYDFRLERLASLFHSKTWQLKTLRKAYDSQKKIITERMGIDVRDLSGKIFCRERTWNPHISHFERNYVYNVIVSTSLQDCVKNFLLALDAERVKFTFLIFPKTTATKAMYDVIVEGLDLNFTAAFLQKNGGWFLKRCWSWLSKRVREMELCGYGKTGHAYILSDLLDTAFNTFTASKHVSGIERLKARLRLFLHLLETTKPAERLKFY